MMKLVDLPCRNCGFDKWEIVFDTEIFVATSFCPQCDTSHVVSLDIRTPQMYEKEKPVFEFVPEKERENGIDS